jgi:hypothetical protein
MADSPEYHGTPDNAQFADMSVRDLLHKSQTDQTRDPTLGLQYATEAYKRSLAEIAEGSTDVTAPAEAAAKAGFRAEQADLGIHVVETWFARSHMALRDANEDTFQYGTRIVRESIATNLLEGRAFSLRNTKSDLHWNGLAVDASKAFARAEREVFGQHMFGQPWDRYATMLSRHRATGEARNWNIPRHRVAGIALGGVWRAIRARRENVSEPAPKDRTEHIKFVGKQALLNAAAGTLGVTRPRLPNTRYDTVHKKAARWLLHG